VTPDTATLPLRESHAGTFLRGAIWMGGSAAAWALVEHLGRLVPAGYSPYQVVFVRYATHLAMMVVALAPRVGLGLVRTRRPLLQVLRSLLMLGMPACFVTAATRMRQADVWGIFWCAPILAAAVDWRTLDAGRRVRRLVALGVGLAGAALAMRAGPGMARPAALLAFGMAACFSLYFVMTRILRTETTTTNLFYTALGVFVALGMLAPLYWRPMTLAALGPMVAIGAAGLGTLLALDRAVAHSEVSSVAPVLLLEVPFACLLRLASGEPAGRLAILGSGVIVAVVAWYVRAEMCERWSLS
jgi:drug/metabolite transporter (DMT)-like permease